MSVEKEVLRKDRNLRTVTGIQACGNVHECQAWRFATGKSKAILCTTIGIMAHGLQADKVKSSFSYSTSHSSCLQSALYSVIAELYKVY